MGVYSMSPPMCYAQTLICSQTLTGRALVGVGQNCARICAQKWPALLSTPYGSVQEGFGSPVGQRSQLLVGGNGP